MVKEAHGLSGLCLPRNRNFGGLTILLMLKQELFMMLGKSCPPTILEEELSAGCTGVSPTLLSRLGKNALKQQVY